MKKTIILKIALLLSLLGVIIAFASFETYGNDAWSHALHGRIIVEKGKFPQFKDYSFIQDQDVNMKTNWVPAVFLHLCVKYFGIKGFNYLKFLGIFLISSFIFLWVYEEKKSWGLSVLAATCTIIISHPRFLPRGDLFNMIFFSIYLYILAKNRLQKTRIIWMLPILQIFWIQFHYLACLGIFAIGCFACENFFGNLFRRLKGKKIKIFQPYHLRLIHVAIFCFLTSFLNLNTYKKVFLPFYTLFYDMEKRKHMFQPISEFRPLLSFIDSNIGLLYTIAFSTPLLAIIVFSLVKRRLPKIPYTIFIVTFSYFTLKHIRFIGLYGIIISPILFTYTFRKIKDKKKECILSILTIVFNISIAYICFSGLYTEYRMGFKNFQYRLIHQPTRAVNFLKKNTLPFMEKQNITVNIYSNYSAGGFVGYHLYPRYRIFIHSLSLWYSYKHYLLYAKLRMKHMNLSALSTAYNVDLFLININRTSNLSLEKDSYILVYLDEISAIYMKKDSPLKPVLKKFIVEDFKVNQEKVTFPMGYIFLSRFMLHRENIAKAKKFAQIGLEKLPKKAIAHEILACIAIKEYKFLTAMKHILIACQEKITKYRIKLLKEILEELPSHQKKGKLYEQSLEIIQKNPQSSE